MSMLSLHQPMLVTGGTGFIGRVLARRLLARGHRVRVLDLIPNGLPAGAEFVQGDVRDPAAVATAMAGVATVFHLAAAHHDQGIAHETYFSVNEGGTRTVTDVAGASGVCNIVFTSSVAVYGVPGGREVEGPFTPDSAYGASKLAAEHVLAAWSRTDPNRRALIVRPAVVFGEGNMANMYSLIRQVHRHRYLRVGKGANRKSMVFVENLVDAMSYLCDLACPDAVSWFNLVDTPDLSSTEIMSSIERALGRAPLRLALPMPAALALAVPFELASRVVGRPPVISRARIRKFAESETSFPNDRLRASGFSPKVSIDEGIRRMVTWYVTEGRHLPVERRLPPDQPWIPGGSRSV
jgi:nucleoside-diphosphate-sugar epimerase